MKALILAAGYATRLYPLTKAYPKPLLPIGQRPIVDYIIEKLENIDKIDEIAVVTNSKFILRFRKWLSTQHSQKHISLVDDLTKNHHDRRGAIGDMYFAIEKKCIEDDLLVIGGDNLFDNQLKELLTFAKAKEQHPIIGVYDIRDLEQSKKYGVVKLDNKSQVIDFKEKPKNPKSTLVAMCLYYFPKEKIKLIKEYLSNRSNKYDASGFYIDWLRKKEPVYGFVFSGRWFDIGDTKFYKEAQKRYQMKSP